MVLMRTVIDSALSEVYGHAQTIDTTTYLAGPITASSLEIPITDATRFSRGMVQIDNELLLIDTVDRTENVMRLAYEQGRGIRGTAATDHSIGSLVTMAPSVPRHTAVSAVEETVVSTLFRATSETFTMLSAQTSYPVPAGVDDVLDVSWLPPGPSMEWLPIRHWTFDRHAQALVVYDSVQPGRQVRYTAKRSAVMVAEDDDFAETGLPTSCIDVIRYGAAWKMCAFLEPYNVLVNRAETEAMGRTRTPGSRLAVSKYYYQLYQQRLQEETIDLLNKWPVKQHFSAQW